MTGIVSHNLSPLFLRHFMDANIKVVYRDFIFFIAAWIILPLHKVCSHCNFSAFYQDKIIAKKRAGQQEYRKHDCDVFLHFAPPPCLSCPIAIFLRLSVSEIDDSFSHAADFLRAFQHLLAIMVKHGNSRIKHVHQRVAHDDSVFAKIYSD